MNTKGLVFLWLLLVAGQVLGQKPDGQGPNIVIIVADDLGYSDIGSYGSEIRTPNLDALASGGLRMINFYNNARCSPTRASLLTGQYAHKVGLAKNGTSLSRNGATIAELLKENGYRTAMVGKWHLSADVQLPSKEDHLKWLNHQLDPDKPFAPVDTYPVNRGFQKHYGVIWGVVDYFDPFSLVEGTTAIRSVPRDFYITDAITQKAVEYIHTFAGEEKPFFLYLAHTSPHWPIQAKAEDIAKYKDTYRLGWDTIRKQRYDRLVQNGLIDPKTTPLLPVAGNEGTWEKLPETLKEKMAMKMAVHAAMVDRMDQGIGKVMEALRQTNRFDNTLIIFLSDNGASPEVVKMPGYDRPSETRDGQPLKYDKDLTDIREIGSQLSFTGIGSNWANAANTPFRYWKIESYEGGVRTPMIIHWPRGLKVKGGSTEQGLGHVIDVLPTLLDIAGIAYPLAYKGTPLTALDGKSFTPALRGETYGGHDALFFEHASGKAVIMNSWKLVQKVNGTSWELFNLATDRNEQNNLAIEFPSKAAEMRAAWEAWYARMQPYIESKKD